MSLYYDLEQDDRLAVKKAVALAVSRYNDTIGKFVQDKPDRLSIVSDKLDRIARECAAAVKADEDDTLRLFSAYLADRTSEVAVSEPEKQNVTDKAEYNNSDEVPQPTQKDKPGVRDDVKGTDAVLDDNPAEHMEMPSGLHHDFISKRESTTDVCPNCGKAIGEAEKCLSCGARIKENEWKDKDSKVANPQPQACPYCGHMMTPVQNPQNPGMSGQMQTCPNCGASVTASPPAGQQQPGTGQPGFQQGMQTGIGGGMYAKCARCEKEAAEEDSIMCQACNSVISGQCPNDGSHLFNDDEGKLSCTVPGCEYQVAHKMHSSVGVQKYKCDDCGDTFTGDPDEVDSCPQCGGTVHEVDSKEAAGDLQDPDLPLDENTQSPAESDATGDQQPALPPAVNEDSNGPAQVYTGVVQQTANANAAMAWSTPGEDDIQKISQQFGLDPDQVRKNLRIVADFGDALAVNGDPNADPNVEGLTEVPGFGGQIPEKDEGVDVKTAIQHTAERTNLSPDDVYALVTQSYGDDIGDKHHVSVTGEAHYYLPSEMVPQQQQQPQQDTDSPNETPQQAMQSSVPAHLSSLAAYLEWEKAQLAQSVA